MRRPGKKKVWPCCAVIGERRTCRKTRHPESSCGCAAPAAHEKDRHPDGRLADRGTRTVLFAPPRVRRGRTTAGFPVLLDRLDPQLLHLLVQRVAVDPEEI